MCLEPFCRKSFEHQTELEVHGEAHLETRPLVKCPVDGCGKSYRSRTALAEHALSHTANPRPFKCQFPRCDKAYSNKWNLRRHEQLHSSEPKPHKCPVTGCTRSYRDKLNLNVHLRNIHGDDSIRVKHILCSWPGCKYANYERNQVYRHIRMAHFGLSNKGHTKSSAHVNSAIYRYIKVAK